MKCFARWMLLIFLSFLFVAGFEKNDMKNNSYDYFTRSRELASIFYSELDLSEYEETIVCNDTYVVVYYHLPIPTTGGGGPCFFYDTETDELLFSFTQY